MTLQLGLLEEGVIHGGVLFLSRGRAGTYGNHRYSHD